MTPACPLGLGRTRGAATKLTVTIDEEVVPRAKRYARARGVSLSSLIEKALRDMTGPEEGSVAERWRGRLALAALYRALLDKYG